jgi:hypothetical protein
VGPAVTLLALARAGTALGYRVRRRNDTLALCSGTDRFTLRWPPQGLFPKSSIPALIGIRGPLRSCATRPLKGMKAPPWLPGCVKPDLGRGGEGFRAFSDPGSWERVRKASRPSAAFVVQPLLRGPEFRVSVCADGTYAVARLARRAGLRSLWRDQPRGVPANVVRRLRGLVSRLGCPGIGFDLIRSEGRYVLLDVNRGPSLAVHEATDRPRDLATPFLRCWIDLRRKRSR